MYQVVTNDLYADQIKQFVYREFPAGAATHKGERLDMVTDVLVGTGKTRLGPKPSPENLVSIRQVLSEYMDKTMPIPVMVPWGSEKPVAGEGVDIAELAGLKTLACLNDRVKAVYSPGLEMNIRVEDASAPYLFSERFDEAWADARNYTHDLMVMIRVLGLTGSIKAMPESNKIGPVGFAEEAEKYRPAMEEYLLRIWNSEGAYEEAPGEELVSAGWKGVIRQETFIHFLDTYSKVYPGNSAEQNIYIMAKYYASSLARAELGLRGDIPQWHGRFLDLSFMAPTPGVPRDFFPRRLYYRTIPGGFTNNHIAPWRAKGYLRIIGEGAIPSIASWREPLELNRNEIVLDGKTDKVIVRADYVVEE